MSRKRFYYSFRLCLYALLFTAFIVVSHLFKALVCFSHFTRNPHSGILSTSTLQQIKFLNQELVLILPVAATLLLFLMAFTVIVPRQG